MITYFENPHRTKDSQLTQEPKKKLVDENCPLWMEIKQQQDQPVRHTYTYCRYTVQALTKHLEGTFSSCREDAPAYEGMVDDDQVRLEWSALDDAAAMADATVKQEKRAKDQDLIREALVPQQY